MKLRITLEGKPYDVDVEFMDGAAGHHGHPDEEELARIAETLRHAPPPPSDYLPGDKICCSPIAGVIVAVLAAPGQMVRKDDPLLTIEAMKMQSTIGAPADGQVSVIRAAPGMQVKTGEILVELA